MTETKFDSDNMFDPDNTSSSGSSVTKDFDGCWYGDLPCGYDKDHRCIAHRPMLSPTCSNPVLEVSMNTWWQLPVISTIHGKLRHLASSNANVLDSVESVATDEEVKPEVKSDKKLSLTAMGSLFSSTLPSDTASTLTLEPMLPVMSYRLAYYHLDNARRHLFPGNDVTFIPELSCSDSARFGLYGRSFDWSSELYYSHGSFLQRQEICFTLDKKQSRCPPLELRVCHHQRAKFSGWELRNDCGPLDASVQVSFSPLRKNGDHPYTWRNARGANPVTLYACTRCHCDFKYYVEKAGRQVNIRFACYKDLGTATDRFEPRWHSHLTDKGLTEKRPSPWQTRHDGRSYRSNSLANYELYRRVWQTAERLNRPNLHRVTFENLQGNYNQLRMTGPSLPAYASINTYERTNSSMA
ncbi:hypothetical protein PG984_015914 [Apiospora sp. TS-2023a]